MNSNEAAADEAYPTLVPSNSDNGFTQPPPLRARLLCEFIGTCLFIFFGAGCAEKGPAVGLLTPAIAHALSLMWLIYVLGPVSGGHFNAGATIAFAIDGKMTIIEIIGYLVSQALGSLLAGVLLLAVYGTGTTLGTPDLSPGIHVMRGFAVEFICTIALSFVIFFTTSYNSQKEAAFPIGLVILSSFLIGFDRDGTALNPWRWFGPAAISGTFHSTAWIYVVGPIAGFVVGYVLFRVYKLFWNSTSFPRF